MTSAQYNALIQEYRAMQSAIGKLLERYKYANTPDKTLKALDESLPALRDSLPLTDANRAPNDL